MRKLLFVGLSLFCLSAQAQLKTTPLYHLKMSAGRVLFGTGDIPGYGIYIEGSKNLLKQPEGSSNRLLAGIEFAFESGAKRPVVENPTTAQYGEKSFAQVSNSLISGKLTWYPFGSVLSGLNLVVGPSVGYTHFVAEASRRSREIYPGYTRTETILYYGDAILFGYRISVGYELPVTKKISLGIRADFSSYDNGNINTLAAGKLGYRF